MKTGTRLLVALVAVVTAAYPLSAASESGTPVVVELFTSEACSSCPPADALLTRLGRQRVVNGAEVFVLSEHVDNFNHLGWSDSFSSSTFTERQNRYARRFQINSPYTPQIVVGGHFEGLGSDAALVERAINLAAHRPEVAKVVLHWVGPDALHVDVSGVVGERSDVFLAVTEGGLASSLVGGENNGRVLQHSVVVREFRQLGSSGQLPAAYSPERPRSCGQQHGNWKQCASLCLYRGMDLGTF